MFYVILNNTEYNEIAIIGFLFKVAFFYKIFPGVHAEPKSIYSTFT